MNKLLLSSIALMILAFACFIPTGLQAIITDGESLTFSINYGVVSAAEATLEVKSSTYQDKPIWRLNSSAKTYPFFDSVFLVRDTVQSFWDKETLTSLRFFKHLNEGNYHQYRIHTYNHEQLTSSYMTWNFKKKTKKLRQVVILPKTQDILSAFYLTRQQILVPGKSVLINVTTDGKTYVTQVVVHRRETIDSIYGKKSCLVIEPKLKSEGVFKQSGRILIWITDDIYKVPLRMTSKVAVGAFTATLKSAKHVPYPLK
jgi:hypothetical protein